MPKKNKVQKNLMQWQNEALPSAWQELEAMDDEELQACAKRCFVEMREAALRHVLHADTAGNIIFEKFETNLVL